MQTSEYMLLLGSLIAFISVVYHAWATIRNPLSRWRVLRIFAFFGSAYMVFWWGAALLGLSAYDSFRVVILVPAMSIFMVIIIGYDVLSR